MSTPMPRPAPVTNQTFFSAHAGALLLLDPQVVLGTALSVVHCYRTTRRPPEGAPDDGATDRDLYHHEPFHESVIGIASALTQ